MADPAFPNPELAKLVSATQTGAAATLAAVLIASANRPHSVKEALDILRDFQYAMYPMNGNDHYEAWKKEFNPVRTHL